MKDLSITSSEVELIEQNGDTVYTCSKSHNTKISES